MPRKLRGFQIEYNTYQLFTSCGGNFSDPSGIITSPNYPNPYPNLADCIYLISQPKGTYINISFINFDVYCQESVPSYIEVRDGDSEVSPEIGKFCGNDKGTPSMIISTNNHLRIR